MKGLRTLIGVNSLVLGGFGIAAVMQQNIEFIYYLGVVTVLATLIVLSTRVVKYPRPLLWGLSIWGWMHMAGGTVPIADNILYDTIIIPLIGAPYHVLRYDQIIHVYGTFLVTIASWYILRTRLSGSALFTAGVVFLVGLGLGAINETIEFVAVLTIEHTYVGDYYNLALDLIANVFGAGIAALWVYQREDK